MKQSHNIHQRYDGRWKQNNLMNYFTEQEGLIRFLVNSDEEFIQMSVFLYDGNFIDTKMIELPKFQMNQTNNKISEFKMQLNQEIKMYDKFKLQNIKKCDMNYEIKFAISDFKVNASILSEQCNINIIDSVSQIQNNYQAYNYYLSIMIGIILMKIYSFSKIYEQIINDNYISKDLSITTMILVFGWDLIYSVINFYMGIHEQEGFYYIIACSYIQFLFCVIFQIKLIILVFRLRILQNHQSIRSQRLQLVKFYFTLCVFLAILFLLVINYWQFFPFFCFSQLILVPQIYKTAYNGRKVSFELLPFVLYTISTMLIPLYFKLNQYNVIQISPSFFQSLFLLSFLSIQVLFVILQKYLSARFFIPLSLQPAPFKYKLVESYNHNLLQLQCGICIENLNNDLINLQQNDYSVKIEQNIIQTPCNHIFHQDCLQLWMCTKIKCPSCNQNIPEPPVLRDLTKAINSNY